MSSPHPPASRRYRPTVIVAIAFTAAYLLAAAVGAATTGNAEFVFYIAVMLVLIAAIAVVHWRVNLGNVAIWGLALWGAAHMAGGLVPVPASWPINGEIRVLYSWWLVPGLLKYDHVVHAFGFGVTTLVCWEGLASILAECHGLARAAVVPTFGTLLLCAAAAVGFGAANEVVEFAATLLVPETNVGGYENTGWDLVANMAGAILAAAVIAMRRRRPV